MSIKHDSGSGNMESYSNNEWMALKHLSDALQALDRTEHAQIAAITSHALEMLRSSGAAVADSTPMASIYCK